MKQTSFLDDDLDLDVIKTRSKAAALRIRAAARRRGRGRKAAERCPERVVRAHIAALRELLAADKEPGKPGK